MLPLPSRRRQKVPVVWQTKGFQYRQSNGYISIPNDAHGRSTSQPSDGGKLFGRPRDGARCKASTPQSCQGLGDRPAVGHLPTFRRKQKARLVPQEASLKSRHKIHSAISKWPVCLLSQLSLFPPWLMDTSIQPLVCPWRIS